MGSQLLGKKVRFKAAGEPTNVLEGVVVEDLRLLQPTPMDWLDVEVKMKFPQKPKIFNIKPEWVLELV